MLIEPKGKRDVTLIGTGSEVSLAVEAAKQLEGEGIKAAVVSMPCFELFDAQDEAYRDAVLGKAARVVPLRPLPDSAGRDGSAPNGAFVGMRGFGASAPAQDLYKHFGITADAVAAAARDLTSAKKRKGKKAKAKKKGKG